MKSIDSKALEANLILTRADVNILAEHHQWLLDQSKEYYGIHQRTENFFKELHHPYVNSQYVIDLFQQTILNDLWFYLQLEESTRALKEILNLFIQINKLKLETVHKKRLLTNFLDFAGALAENSRSDVLEDVVVYLFNWSREDRSLFIYACGMFRKAARSLIPHLKDPDHLYECVKKLLRENIELWQENSKVINWLKPYCKTKDDFIKLEPVLGSTFYQTLLQKLDKTQNLQDLAEIPSYQEIAAHHRQAINLLPTLYERIHYTFYLLRLPSMADLYEYLLWDLNKLLGEISNLPSEEVRELIESVFKILREFRSSHPSIVLDCVLTIGKAISGTSNEELFQECLDHIVNIGFIGPGKIRIDDNWQINVDRNHIKNIRVWLALISIDPPAYKDLLAALTFSLIQKGVFVFDTDLFQKDVSSFLNSDIESCYIQVKHLLKLFPVFFNEIGAEGEIRDYTTRIDELVNRKDRLIHFLRKQVHIESNNTHVILTKNILNFWYDLNINHLSGLIPQDVVAYLKGGDEHLVTLNKELGDFLQRTGLDMEGLLNLPKQNLDKIFKNEDVENNVFLKKIYQLCKIYYLLLEKYQFDSFDIVQILKRSPFYVQKDYVIFYRALIRKDYDACINLLFDYIAKLNEVILDPQPSTGWENIYHKRHIAAGIPSVYGNYREQKFEAIGLIFRMESVIGRLVERYIKQLNLSYITAKTLKRIIRILDIFYKGLKLENVNNEALRSSIKMLRSGYRLTNLSLGQYIDIFNRLKDSVNEIINEYYYRFYEYTLNEHDHNFAAAAGKESPGAGKKGREHLSHIKQRKSEEFYRDLLSSSFLVQEMDNFISQILLSLKAMKSTFTPEQVDRVMSYDPDILIISLSQKNPRLENQILLGSKAYFLRKMYDYKFPIPPGVVITTEFYRYHSVICAHSHIFEEYESMVEENLRNLELSTDLEFGNYLKPLLLSVRSGAPMSLPGAMNTFLNVGMNDEITLNLSKQPNFSWTAWDSYRRLIQSWGMSYGIPRDEFDNMMLDYKKRYGIGQKTEFSPRQMQEMTGDYKKILEKHNVRFEQDPYKQLKETILNVLDSWNSERAILYRQKLNIADEWGTAIIIQKMVFGNISLESGSGVVFTHYERSSKPGINLNGDFTLCSQGEDVVAGLVYTFPISEEQREIMNPRAEYSLELKFPRIYEQLLKYAHKLLDDYGYPHQEIEFTFEGPEEDQLFLLQTRDQIVRKKEEYTVFNMKNKKANLIGHGIGINKGAINGYIAFSHEDIKYLQENNLTPIILVRPDTVPDDMDLLFECQGLLTSRGGVTSHAAVTASHLGITGIVNCRELIVHESPDYGTINKKKLQTGDKLAIDANSGNIYLGHYPVERMRT